jgi:hypothetical protein
MLSMKSIVQLQYVWNTFTRLKRLLRCRQGPGTMFCRLRSVHVAPRALHSAAAGECRRAMCCRRLDPCTQRQCLPASTLSLAVKRGECLARRPFGVRRRVSRKVSGLMGEGTMVFMRHRPTGGSPVALSFPALWPSSDPVERFCHVGDDRVSLCLALCSIPALLSPSLSSQPVCSSPTLQPSLARLHRFCFMLVLC